MKDKIRDIVLSNEESSDTCSEYPVQRPFKCPKQLYPLPPLMQAEAWMQFQDPPR